MTENKTEYLVELRSVTYTHWNHQEPTLKGVSLKIQRGTLNVLVGPSGSGKTTLCDLLNGKIPHLLGGELEGDVLVDQVNTRDVEVKDLACKVGHVFQDPESMFAMLYVDDEIAFGPENLRVGAGEIRERVARLLGLTQLSPFQKNMVWNLSGGQVQKLGVAAALAMDPDLVVLDEPTSNLDPAATRSMHELFLSLRDQGKTVLLVTRELDDFLASADQLLVLDDGCLLASGSPKQVLAAYGDRMTHSLGVWLPETTEIGLALLADDGGERKENAPTAEDIPITVDEVFPWLERRGVYTRGLAGLPEKNGSSSPGDLLVSAKGLRFSYGAGVNALKGVSLEIRAGEMLAIVGRNGAGKSTLAKLMVGLLKPQEGELTLFGKPASQWKVQDLANHIALVFQNPEHQFLTDTVADEIGYSLLAQGISNLDEQKEVIDRTLRMLGLEKYPHIHPFSLSAGMKRRLGVATMLVGQPDILLVDEPTYGQDKQMTETLMALMEEIRAKGIAVVMITHDMRLVQEYAGRVVVLSEGQILYDGSPGGLFERSEVLQAANLRTTILNELLRGLVERGVAVTGEFRTTQDFLRAVRLPVEREVKHDHR